MVQILPDDHRRSRWYTFTKPKSKSILLLIITITLGLLFVCYSNIELSSSRKVLRSSWASVISGSDEGIYAWVIANYALDSLGGDPLQTTGIVELGGASAQVAFVSSEVVPPEFSRTISYGGVAYKIYSHSFLHYGQDTAQEDLYESLQNSGLQAVASFAWAQGWNGYLPCTPKGYMAGEKSLNGSFGNSAEESRFTATVQAAGNFSQCRSLTAMLQKGKGKNHYRYIIPRFFELEETAWLSKMIPAAKSFCGEEWSKLKEKCPTTKDRYLHGIASHQHILSPCFMTVLVLLLMMIESGLRIMLEPKTHH
ncbi:hypothetical protein IGI04_026455 [Brassica rapa subsp. trilocularis]|uniref:apyrase n=1 Tax=Brassica rapa subsp. trilocularis TaxID=1813537 RepID=A0ABQ7KZY5_BRACM|nr:hypothetical protein IGI04_026455 [Brassica rapa subsp. trilocularis]